MPGYTGEATLRHRTRGNYRSWVARADISEATSLTFATAKDGRLEWIDCNDFPEGSYCRECGNAGPDSVVCCPDDYCAIIDKRGLVRGTQFGRATGMHELIRG